MTFAASQQIELFPTLDDFRPSSSEARPARTSAQPTPKAKASKASGQASTSRLSVSSEKSALVGSLLRTALISELEAQTSYSLHWKNSATPAGRSWSVLATSEPTMSARDHGSSGATSSRLPTPITNPSGGQSNPGLKAKGVIYPALGPLLEISAGRMEPGRYRGDMEGWARMGTVRHQLQKAQEGLPTPTKRDKRMDRWSPAYNKRKSPTMDAVLDGAMTGKAPGKWDYARQIATMLSDAGLTGPSMTLPITYNWMMGFPPGWLGRALRSAVHAGLLQQASSSKRSVMPSSRKSQKR